MLRSSNPTLRAYSATEAVFNEATVQATGRDGLASIQGTVNKTALLLVILFFTALFSWNKSMQAVSSGLMPPMYLLWVGLIGGLVTALVTVFVRRLVMYTAPVYALFEGLFLGVLSAMLELQFPGIVSQAVFATFGVFATMLFLYKSQVIRVTERFKLGVVAATGGIFFLYLITFILSLFNVNMPFVHSSGPIGIGFSVIVVGIAALNLLLDFDVIAKADGRAPKFMEWYGAFALLVTLVWLYIEILRLLAKLNSRR